MPEHNREYPDRAYDPARRVDPSTGWAVHPNWGDRGPNSLATSTGTGGVLLGPVEPSDFQRERLAKRPGGTASSHKVPDGAWSKRDRRRDAEMGPRDIYEEHYDDA